MSDEEKVLEPCPDRWEEARKSFEDWYKHGIPDSDETLLKRDGEAYRDESVSLLFAGFCAGYIVQFKRAGR